nr:L-gulonolactone oxidase-like [Pocillopora verrucosa]
MGNSVDCCYNSRWSYQCIFPCIRFCTYTGRRVFYNYDGMEKVQPLVHIYHPRNGRVHSLPDALYGIDDDDDIQNQIKSHKGLDGAGQIAALCKYAADNGYTIRAVGTGSSWSRLTHTRDILVVMTDLNKILTVPKILEDSQSEDSEMETTEMKYEVEVQAGKRVVDFVEELDRDHHKALKMMGNYAGQTVGGVASTSTHGSGWFSGTMSTFVVGLHLIVRGGIQVKVRGGPETIADCEAKIDGAKYGDDPVEIKSSEVLKACQVGLGCMGVIYSITYSCVPMYKLEEIRKTEQVSWPEVRTEDDEGNNDGDDALIGKKLQLGEVLKKFAKMYKTKDAEYFSFFVNPYPQGPRNDKHIEMAYLKAFKTDRKPTCRACCSCCCNCCGGRGIADLGCMQSDCTASCLQGCANCCPTSIPQLTNFGVSQFSFEKPYRQTWYNVLQFTKGNIHVRTAEWCLPLEHLHSALTMVIKLAQDYAERHKQYSLLPIYVRLARSDDLFLSPASKFRPDGTINDHNCYIEVPFLPGAFGIDEFQETVENKLCEEFKARPHWGKNNRLNQSKIEAIYHKDSLEKWGEVYRIFNKGGPFENLFTHHMGFAKLFDYPIDKQPSA